MMSVCVACRHYVFVFVRFGPLKHMNMHQVETGKQLIIAYENRRDAERALREGSLFDGQPLAMSWHNELMT